LEKAGQSRVAAHHTHPRGHPRAQPVAGGAHAWLLPAD
jgi:hypothetical protein